MQELTAKGCESGLQGLAAEVEILLVHGSGLVVSGCCGLGLR